MANGFKELKPFRYWCAKVLPLVYDDSLSYYELLGKVIESLNLTMEDVELLNDYFDGIEVQEEIDAKIDRMAADGSLTELLKPYIDSQINPALSQIPGYVSGWLEDNIEAGDVVIDDSFTVVGAAADAYRTGDLFRRLNCFDLLESFTKTSSVHEGVSYQWDDDSSRCFVEGTATADSVGVYMWNEQSKLIGYPYPCYPGDVVQYMLETTDTHIYVDVSYYIGSEWVYYHHFNKDFVSVIPEGASGMRMRLSVAAGTEVDGSIKVHAFNTASNKTLQKGCPVLIPSDFDCQAVIEQLLTTYGGVQLGKGTYYIGGTINMPENSVIRGMGAGTVIQARGAAVTYIKAAKNCIIEDLYIKGTAVDGLPLVDGTHNAILIDGAGGSSYIYNPKISKVSISNIPGAGIHVQNTGGDPLNSVTISDCQIWWCFNGILLNYGGEYTRVSNTSVFQCYHGVDNSSGNNKFTGCDFSSNFNAMVVADPSVKPESYTSNNGHGSFVGCTFNHSNNNEGYAIIIFGLEHGMVFEGCQFWYGTLFFSENDSPALFNGCEFRGTADTSFSIYKSDAIVNGSLLKNAMTNSVTQGSLVFNNCYLADMTPVT